MSWHHHDEDVIARYRGTGAKRGAPKAETRGDLLLRLRRQPRAYPIIHEAADEVERLRRIETVARAAAARFQQPGECIAARFERVAEMFRRETGFLAPGKDEPAAAYAGEDRERERVEAWNAWSRKPIDDLIAALAPGGPR